MTAQKLSDAEAKETLLKWPTRTKLWPPPGARGFWLRGQPREGKRPGPRLHSPGAEAFHTQPDGLWIHFDDTASCDVVAIEICGTVQNLNDKRSRYIPASHSLMLSCSAEWLNEEIRVQRGGMRARWRAASSFKSGPKDGLAVAVRHLRVLYAIPNDDYQKWCRSHTPTGYEFFCQHSSLKTYSSPRMQKFLRQMSSAAQFFTKVKPK